jgi:hypothetical protein
VKSVRKIELHHATEFDERTAFEIEQKGWYDGAIAKLSDGRRFALSFVDPTRLAPDIQSDFSHGQKCVVFRHLVVIPSVTVIQMEAAVHYLFETGEFERMAPTA